MKTKKITILLSILFLVAFGIVWSSVINMRIPADISGHQNSLQPAPSSSQESTDRQDDNGLGWHIIVQDKSPLSSPPLVEARVSEGEVIVTVQNRSAEFLHYKGSGKNYPQHFLEDFKNGDWVAERWDWCGTGMEKWPLPPGQTVQFRMPRRINDGKRERIYTKFTSEDGAKAAFVLLDENQ